MPNSHVSDFVYALSGASSSYGDRLFVGGSFAEVGPSRLVANNIAMLNPNPTNNPTWSSLGTGAANGTDNVVRCLAAYQWWDLYFGYSYDSIIVYVGGDFDKAGNLTSPSIASWQGLGQLYSSIWRGIGNGVEDSLGCPSSSVRGCAADIFLYAGQSYLSGLYLAGCFQKTVGSVINYNVAKWNGSAWRNLGQGLLHGGLDQNCNYVPQPYAPMFGYCAAFASGTAYFGGFFDDVRDKNGIDHNLPIYGAECYCGICGWLGLNTTKVGSTEILYSGPDFHVNYGPAHCMTTKQTTPYVGGVFRTDDGTQEFYGAKLDSSQPNGWQALPTGQPGSLDGPAISATADSSSVYFATIAGVFRYVP